MTALCQTLKKGEMILSGCQREERTIQSHYLSIIALALNERQVCVDDRDVVDQGGWGMG